MRFLRSLRKTIAASLAFTVLTIPIAGCDFLDDFFGDDKPPASTSGKKNESKLPKDAVSFKLPRPNDERLLVEAVGMDALRYYVHARICTEKLSRMDAKNSKPKEYKKLLQTTAKLWAYAERFADMAEKLSKRLAEKERKPGYKPLAMIDSSPFGNRFFFSVAHAREGWGDERSPKEAGQEDRKRERRLEELRKNPTLWAQEISNMYRAAPMGDKLNGLAAKLGTDAKSAKAELDKAMNTLNKQGTSDAKLYDIGMRTAAATKGTCQVALFVGGVILSAPLLATGAAPAAVQIAVGANWYAGLADTVVEGVNDAHIVFTGDSNPGLDEMKKYTGTISAITSGVTIATSFSNFALMGEQAIKNTHDTLKAANLGTQGFLDSYNIGGAGVSAVLDSSIWTADRVTEISKGKVFGFQVFTDKKGNTVLIPVEVPKDQYKPPQELSKIANSELQVLAMTPDNLKNLFQQINALTDTDNLAKEIAEEDARRRQEMADEEARRRNEAKRNGNVGIAGQVDMYKKVQRIQEGRNQSQSQSQSRNRNQKPEEDLPYEPPKLAGYYTITSPSGDVAMRAYIKATGDNAIRAVQVQKKTDKKGTALFSATIDPKTGRGKTDQGAVVQFSRNGSGAYTGVLEDGYKTWRMTKH